MAAIPFFLFLISFSAASANVCPPESLLDGIYSMTRCPLLSRRIPPLEVDGNSLDEALNLGLVGEGYTSILFYAKWCPFSLKARATFDVLSSMFPHIKHLALEESSVLPSVFSRYAIHSLPAFLMVNRTSRVRYHGPKDIHALVGFYKKITGTEPETPQPSLDEEDGSIRTWDGSLKKRMIRERYLIVSFLFLCYRAFAYIFPWVIQRLKAFWRVHVHINFSGIFGNRSPLLEQAAHVLNMKRLWSKLRLAKMRKFQKGARNARVWASSLASMSLGESSSSSSTGRSEAS